MQAEINFNQQFWKDIIGFEGFYQISNLGNIKALKRVIDTSSGKYIRDEKEMKGWVSRGYWRTNLTVKGNNKEYLIHRLIAIHFIPNPLNKPCINHKNGIKHDNRIENLEWCTYGENNKHAFDTGLKFGSRRRKINQSTKQGEFIKEYDSIMRASQETNIIRASIVRHLAGKRPYAGGFLWKYAAQKGGGGVNR